MLIAADRCRVPPIRLCLRVDTILGLLLMACGAWCYLALSSRTQDALHPLGLFLLGWLGVFGFAHVQVPRTFVEQYYAEPFGLLTYGVIAGALLSFVFGYLLVQPRLDPLDRESASSNLDASFDVSRLSWATLGLFLIASATTLHFVRVAGAIPLFSPRIDELRQTFKLPLLGYLYDLHAPVALFGVMLALRDRRTRWIWWGIVFAAVAQLSLGGVRSSPMTALAWVIVYLMYRARRVRLRHLVIVGAVTVSFFSVIEGFRRTMYETNPALVNPQLDLGPAATAWAHTAASFKNLQLTLERGAAPLNFGLTTYDLARTLNPEARAPEFGVSARYGTHNMPTLLSPLYYDFGWGGLLVMPAIYGALVAVVYRSFRRSANIFWLLIHIDFLLATVLAFRTHRFMGNSLLFFAAVALLVHIVAGRGRLSQPVTSGTG